MAAIQPNSDIWLLNDVPLDNTYQHTIYFASKADQQVTLAARTKVMLSDQSYQRVHRNKLRVQALADDIYDCNYLMFRNTSFGNKWFYCFITEIEYVNNVVSEITYEIDVLQTWMFDYELKPCYVEREHSDTDNIGDNYVPEPLSVGEYVANTQNENNDLQLITDTNKIVVIVGMVDAQGSTEGHSYGRIYGGSTLIAFDFTSSDTAIDAINSLLDQYISRPDAIVSIYIAPKILINATFDPDTKRADLTSRDVITSPITRSADAITSSDRLNGYLPKNKKLYTYPFNFLQLTNAQGEGLVLRYEYFRQNAPQFEVFGSVTQPAELVIRPLNYKGMSSSTKTESLSIKNYPLCSWNVDSYEAWVAQNAIPTISDAFVTGLIGLGISAVNPAIGLGVAASGLYKVGGLLSQSYKATIAADQLKGSIQSASPNIGVGQSGFYAVRMSVSSNEAKIIDDFFSMYGYATNRLKVPNTHARPHWTYTKTVDCVITGSVPSEDSNKICKIYDNGITFWRYMSEVGDYTLNNAP